MMPDVIPRHVVCVLGAWSRLDQVEAVVSRVGGPGFEVDREFSRPRPDPNMLAAFEASYDRVSPSMADDDWQSIQDHSAVAYILSPPIRKEEAHAISGRALLLTAALLREGGLAARGESAGIAHGRARWIELAEGFGRAAGTADGEYRRRAALLLAWVRRPILDEHDGVYYSCGMHLLGERDVEIDSSLDVMEAVHWIDLLVLYLVADRPSHAIGDGDGFRIGDTGPRRVMRSRPCLRYEEDDFSFNPYGYLRLEDEVGDEKGAVSRY